MEVNFQPPTPAGHGGLYLGDDAKSLYEVSVLPTRRMMLKWLFLNCAFRAVSVDVDGVVCPRDEESRGGF